MPQHPAPAAGGLVVAALGLEGGSGLKCGADTAAPAPSPGRLLERGVLPGVVIVVQ